MSSPDDDHEVIEAQHRIVCAVLYQAYANEYSGDRRTSEHSADLDYAADRLEAAFEDYANVIRREIVR